MAYINGVFSYIREAPVDDGLCIGEFSDDLGVPVTTAVIEYFGDRAIDYGGNVRDVPIGVILDEFDGNHYGLASNAMITRKDAKNVLEICNLNKKATIVYG